MQRRGPEVISHHVDGERRPVVFLHTWDTEGPHLAALAAYLGPAQPLYGIEPPPRDDELPESVDEWLAHHRRQLDALDVSPPYRLAGFSFGGVLALELTRRLQAEGIAVEWTGLIDTTRPWLNPRGLRYFTYHWRELRELPSREHRRRYLEKRWRGGTHRTRLRVKIRVARVLSRLHVTAEQPKSLGAARGMPPLKRSIWRSYLAYEPEPFAGPVWLFAGTESRRRAADDPNLRWGRFLPRLTTVVVDGDHFGLFSPEHIGSIGAAFEQALARADDRVEA